MRILHIIGNGLDLAHHMKTSYQDFFNYYLAQLELDEDIIQMKKDIDRHKYETWADLEIGLGQYSNKCNDKDTFLKCVCDIKSNLVEYLKTESEKIKLYEASSLKRFFDLGDLFEPEPRDRYREYLNQLDYPSEKEINIITLNYTDTLETLLNNQRINNTPSLVSFRSIQHIHGTLTSMMAMGVNDSSQIANQSFNTDLDVDEEFVKPDFNDACMNNKNLICKRLIDEADVIVIYGCSVGLSDDKWWKHIGKRMIKNDYPLLVYLPYDEKMNLSAEPNHMLRWTKGYISEIKEKFGIILPNEELFKRVCVAINKQLVPLKRVLLTK